MRGVLESGRPEVVEVGCGSGDGPIGRVRGVFVHRAIPFGADGVLNLVTDVTRTPADGGRAAELRERSPLTTFASR